jgi:periplasmic protein TonB
MRHQLTRRSMAFLLIIPILAFAEARAQVVVGEQREEVVPAEEPESSDDPGSVFSVVEVMPRFPGGEAELFKFLGSNLKYPDDAQDAGIAGVVYVTFVVEKDGSIGQARVLRGIGGGCDEEALRVVRSMPKWEPGMQRGKPVRVQYNLPFRFTLKKPEDPK